MRKQQITNLSPLFHQIEHKLKHRNDKDLRHWRTRQNLVVLEVENPIEKSTFSEGQEAFSNERFVWIVDLDFFFNRPILASSWDPSWRRRREKKNFALSHFCHRWLIKLSKLMSKVRNFFCQTELLWYGPRLWEILKGQLRRFPIVALTLGHC